MYRRYVTPPPLSKHRPNSNNSQSLQMWSLDKAGIARDTKTCILYIHENIQLRHEAQQESYTKLISSQHRIMSP